MRRTRSLRARLLAGVGAVLAVVLVATGGLTLLVVHHVLVDRVDAQVVRQAAQSAGVLGGRPGGPPGGPGGGAGERGLDGEQAREGLNFLLFGLPVGSVGARVEDGAVQAASLAGTSGGFPRLDVWTDEQAAALGRAGPEPSTVDVPGRGDYRVVAASAGDDGVVVGQPLAETTTVVGQLAVAALLLAALGIAVAVLASRAVLSRGLAPLRRVAATATRVSGLPLDRGEVDLAVRVPERDTDPRTEVGQVGAALDRLLVHVAAALSARHRSETQVRQFVADASHELRTPLASVRGYAELARRHEAELPPEVAHALERVESQATRMSGLVEDLLLLARLDAGRPLEREVVELPLLVVDAVSDARVTSPDHRWRLDLPGPAEEEGADEQEGAADEDAGGAASLAVSGDAARLQQVLAALLANARTHTPPGTTVTARVRARPGQVEVVVEDDGPGVDPAVLPEVFERFARADTSRSRAAGSTGLGLAITRAVVSAHGGTVDVESAPGRTAFRVLLPAAAVR
ncbi:cell wall metabolism sensor histidine kinase WalK [uncultured Pseudokineococcus sp.]|uniref:sensor histidine kinase n=1 Tax=uncultured Pseudokineococcus sp. TaxID=1642928 RepID=UPI00262CDE4B|nr:ATP-binding protein [uncultured Pseudokineococcus sp.]